MKRRIMVVLAAVIVLVLSSLTVCAADLTGQMSLLETTQDVEVFDTPDGRKVGNLAIGTAVLTTGEEENGWVPIVYQDINGYVKMEQMKVFGNNEALNNEYANTEMTHKLVFEEIKIQKEQHKQEMIWGIIIVCIVVAIFGTSIVSALKKNKEEKKYKPIYKKKLDNQKN